jgi:hypothetical protein
VDLLDLPVVGEINQAKAAKYLCTTFQASGMLEPVEGTIVPRFGGLFARGSLYCAVFEDAGRELTDDEVMDPKVQ